MSEVLRWKLKGFIPGVEGVSKALFQPWVVSAEDFDRVTAERDALHLLLTTSNERLDKADDDFALLSLEVGQRIELLEGLLHEAARHVPLFGVMDLPGSLGHRIKDALKASEGCGDDT